MNGKQEDLRVIQPGAEAEVTEPEKGIKSIDVRKLSPPARHAAVLKLFESMKDGEKLLVINDHEPVHLYQYMLHERYDFDSAQYRAYNRGAGEWVGTFIKKENRHPSTENHVFTSFAGERQYSDDSFTPVPIYSDKNYKVILVYLKAGQFIPVHAPGVDLIFVVQSGIGEAVAADRTYRISPGDVLIVKRGVIRGIRAETDMEALHVVSPVPGDADHEDVARNIREGRFN
ncbi:MAG: DUF2249 domain-containing protein [Thermoplasmata archaeon]|nr:DUF2249 domain-containing protein [Candidatus Sysuiplasma acidicola]